MGIVSSKSIVLASPNACTGCGACASTCPKACIRMKEDKEGFLQPAIDKKKCIKCHRCERVCPILNPKKRDEGYETQAYVAINKDESIRENSSSGGVFYAIAKWIIEQGGVVFGARFDEKWEVVHDCSETIEGIQPFMRSKYVQSLIGISFEKAKLYLDDGRWVLFSGTPCQLAALRSYLSKDYNRLIQVDLICHGVPSPRVWRDYINEISVRNDCLEGIFFRDKENGWHQQSIRYVFSSVKNKDCCSVVLPIYKDNYLQGFANNYFLRRVCYQCPFKMIHRNSDITLADAWGVERFAPEMDDNKGTSLVLIHSLKGNTVFNESCSSISFREVSIDDALSFNKRATSSVSATRLRPVFFLLNHFLNVSNSIRLTRKAKKVFRCFLP